MLSDGEFVDQPASLISLSCLHIATVLPKTLVLWFKNTLKHLQNFHVIEKNNEFLKLSMHYSNEL